MINSGTPVIAKTVNAVAAIGAAVYFGLVIYNGNTSAFLDEAKKDLGYIEFLIAAMLLNMLIMNKTTRPYVLPLTFVGVVAMLIKSFSVSPQQQHAGTGLQAIKERIASFGAGQTGLLSIFGIDTSAPSDNTKGKSNG